jgi:branched-chain amino acid transport system substrate-binding protein
MKLRTALAGMALISVALLDSSVAAEKKYGPGVTDTEITVGNSVPYSGPASAFSIYGRVMSAYFQMLNERGGINGRKVNLTSLDNGFSPPKAVEASRKLVEELGVLAEVGTVGTPVNVATQKYLNGKKVPQLLISAGGSRFNDPAQFPWTVPSYPGFEMEANIFARYLLQAKPDAKIAVLYQNDDFGKDFLKGLKKGLGDKAAKMVVAEASYELTDATVDSQVTTLQGSGADTLFQFVTPKFAAQAIRKVSNLGWKPLHFVGSPANSVEAVLKPAGLELAVGMVTSQFIKQPGDAAWADDKEVQEYLAFMKKHAPNDNPHDFIGLSGYVSAQLIALALQRCGSELTRENLLKQATTLKGNRVAMLLPGVELNNSPQDYAPYRQLRMARFDGSKWVLVGDAVKVANE